MTQKDYSSIDDLLAEEFAKIDVEVPEEGEDDVVEDDTPVAEEETEQEPVVVEDEKAKEKAKQDLAFAEMRIAKAEAERKAKEEEDFLNELASQSGFRDIESFKTAAQKELSKKKADAAGVNPEVYEKMRQLEARLTEMEAEKARLTEQQVAIQFDAAATKFVSDYGLGDGGKDVIFNRLSELGYSIDDILKIKNPEVFIKGAMVDVIEKQALQNHLKKKESKAKVDSGKLSTSSDVDVDSWEDLLKKDLDSYAKLNGFNR